MFWVVKSIVTIVFGIVMFGCDVLLHGCGGLRELGCPALWIPAYAGMTVSGWLCCLVVCPAQHAPLDCGSSPQ